MRVRVDLYRVLELQNFASRAEIKSAYRRLALKYHPDRPTGNEEKFKEVNAAYQFLMAKKEWFDAELRRYLQPVPVVVRFAFSDFGFGFGMAGTADDSATTGYTTRSWAWSFTV